MKRMKKVLYGLVVTILILGITQCFSMTGTKGPATKPLVSEYAPHTDNDGADVMGFGILRRLPGLWNGPVETTTPAGSFSAWYVDFRPISSAHVGQYSRLDQDTINYLDFFVVKHEGKLKVAMRTEGVFQNEGCVTYEIIDTVDEKSGYYRFSDVNAGENRAYTEFFFEDGTLTMDTYTNKFNQVSPLELHSRWKAVLADRSPAEGAILELNYPQPEMVIDFTNLFQHRSQSIYFDLSQDPFPSSQRPYLGEVTVQISMDDSLRVEDDDEYFLLLTTESLFQGIRYDEENLKYISKYVYLPPGTESYTFDHVHPGTYYLYSYNDLNGDKRHLTGDYMSSNIQNRFTLRPEGSITVSTIIDFVIP